ncbi:LysM peptidoglycan-binding domain-containing M23 family metallopeptidase [Bradyrhizobium sp. S69]|uniref:LysM peptidoglycan-binding domain-containing M23 family metallopeptidase n=1 Tax=Bradyrhizobium sp. S69 TaxID=1641856 RepID=UPI00131D1E45|nr:LysM peptidoglycan-binding domain-containing M23 family metallopeptidase [Bradyrhizobium sp. S69]
MSRVVGLLYSRRVPQVAALALMSIGFAGCSADMSTRLSQDQFSNPFASQPEATGSVQPAPRRELPQYARPQSQYQSAALPPPISAPQSYPSAQSYSSASAGVSGGGRGVGSYAPPAHQPLETTGSVAPRSIAATHAPMQGGTTIIVGTSDTLELLSRRYNVPAAAIMQANGYKGPRTLSPGQQLIIPHAAAVAAAPALAAPAVKPVAVAAAAPSSVHVVNHGDTLLSIARRNHISVAELTRANHLEPSARLSLGMKLVVPGAKTAAAVPPTAAPVAVVAAQPLAAPAAPMTKLAAVDTPQKARLAQAAPNAEEPAVASPVKAAEATGALPTFRWPVRGKVITAYGAKANGKANDGINLAVPEGTPIKAADDGVVAYSGNELKGYGNLVLVRHANGYVTAYAHASELMVKRGDTIKRGQVIAKSGQSGEVQSPQLHFEIRKGSSPVDPLQFLNGA